MDVQEQQSSCHVQQLSLDQVLPNYTLTMCIDGLASLQRSSVTETLNSHLTLAKHSLKSLKSNKTYQQHSTHKLTAYWNERINGLNNTCEW